MIVYHHAEPWGRDGLSVGDYVAAHASLQLQALLGAGRLRPERLPATLRELSVLKRTSIVSAQAKRQRADGGWAPYGAFVRPSKQDASDKIAAWERHAAKMRFTHVKLARFAERVAHNHAKYMEKRARALALLVWRKWKTFWFTRHSLRRLLAQTQTSRLRFTFAKWVAFRENILERRRLVYSIVRTRRLNYERLDTLRIALDVLYAYAELLKEFRSRLRAVGVRCGRSPLRDVMRAWLEMAQRMIAIRKVIRTALASKRHRLFLLWRKNVLDQIALRKKFVERWRQRRMVAAFNLWTFRTRNAVNVAHFVQVRFRGARGRERARRWTSRALRREARRDARERRYVTLKAQEHREKLARFCGGKLKKRYRLRAIRNEIRRTLWGIFFPEPRAPDRFPSSARSAGRDKLAEGEAKRDGTCTECKDEEATGNGGGGDGKKEEEEAGTRTALILRTNEEVTAKAASPYQPSRYGSRARARILYRLRQRVLGRTQMNREDMLAVLHGAGIANTAKKDTSDRHRETSVDTLTPTPKLLSWRTLLPEFTETFAAFYQEVRRIKRWRGESLEPELRSCADRLLACDGAFRLRWFSTELGQAALFEAGHQKMTDHARKAFRTTIQAGEPPPWVCPTCDRSFPLWGELALHREATEHSRHAIVRRRSTCALFHGERVVEVQARVTATLARAEAGFARTTNSKSSEK